MKIVSPRWLPEPWGAGSWAMSVGRFTFGVCHGVTAKIPLFEGRHDDNAAWWMLALPGHRRLNVTRWRA